MLFERVELWEQWLEAHPEHPGVRLKMRKKRSTAPGITYDEALDIEKLEISACAFGIAQAAQQSVVGGVDALGGGPWPRLSRSAR